MKHIKQIKFLLVAVLMLALTSSFAQVTILSGFMKGSYYEMANDIKTVCGDKIKLDTVFNTGYKGGDSISFDRSKVPFIKILTSKGALHNFNKLTREDKPQLALMQYDVLFEQQLKDIKKYKKRTDSVRVVLPLGYEEIHLITLHDNKINNIGDLKKKRVAVGAQTQGTRVTSKLIKEKTGIEWQDVEISFDDAIHALLTDKIDAFFFVGSAPVTNLNGLSPTFSKLKIVPIKFKALEDIYTKTTIPAGTYHWLKEDVETYAVRLILIADITQGRDSDAGDIKKLVNDIQNNIGDLQEDGHPNWKKVDFNFGDIKWEIHDVSKSMFDL